MTAPARRLLDEALALPEDQRRSLAETLFDSVAAPRGPDLPEVPGEEVTGEEHRAAWDAEIDRRIARADAGVEPSVPWEVVRERMRRGERAGAG